MTLICNGCGKTVRDHVRVVAGPPHINLCEECIGVFVAVLESEPEKGPCEVHAFGGVRTVVEGRS